jgi:hypothetical protein
MQVDDVRVDEVFEYDPDIALQVYRYYLVGFIPIGPTITYLRRGVLAHYRKRYFGMPLEVIEDLTQQATMEIWRQVAAQNVPAQDRVVMNYYLSQIERAAAATVFGHLFDDACKEMVSQGYSGTSLVCYSTVEDVDDRIFLEEELPAYVLKRLAGRVRWPGHNYVEAAEYVVDRILHGSRVVPAWLRQRFRVRDPGFFYEHVVIQVRSILYDVRERFTPLHRNRESGPERHLLESAYEELGGLNNGFSDRSMDLLKLMLLESADKTHLPEFLDIFGRDTLLKFLDIFAGTTVKVPSRKCIENAIRDVSIFVRLERTPSGSKARLVRDLASEFGLNDGQVRKSYYEVEKKADNYQSCLN